MPGELVVSAGNNPVGDCNNQPSPVLAGLDISSGCLKTVTRAKHCTEIAAGLAWLVGAAVTITRAGNTYLTHILRENTNKVAGPG